VPRVHEMLETHIRGEREPLVANLRAFPPRGTINEVWNPGIYTYVASYHASRAADPAVCGSSWICAATPGRC
jgi:hypothetical protein